MRRLWRTCTVAVGLGCVLTCAALVARAGGMDGLTDKQKVGKLIYFDTNLSRPMVQSCASCHAPEAGFADPDASKPVSDGAVPMRVGGRNAPSAAYATFSPAFKYDADRGLYVGGQFWDGRAADLVEQAKGPFLNPLEMNNPNKLAVVLGVRNSAYADLFKSVYGPDVFNFANVQSTYDKIADAIAAFEAAPQVSPFTSKFDAYVAGKVALTAQEKRGLDLFNSPTKGNCAACHPSSAGEKMAGVFTDFTYDNLGIPKNWENPFLYLPKALNPAGKDWIDIGLAGNPNINPAHAADSRGKFKVPTLRNIERTAPYGHNGFFKTLKDIVAFYNTRDVPAAKWPAPEVPENVNTSELGDLGLTDAEVDDIVVFLLTLTDGYAPPAP